MKNELSRCTDRLILSLLTMMFVALKLTGVIDWNWIWVVSPIWINILFFILLTFFTVVIGPIDEDDDINQDDHTAIP